MTCNRRCNCCNRRLISTSIVVTGTAPNQVLTITVPTQTFTNLERRCLIIAQSIPAGASNLPVVIENGTDVIPVRVRTGNNLRADQIRSRRRYQIIYGDDPIHFSLECGVPYTCFSTAPALLKENE